jgi:hypothetical protein
MVAAMPLPASPEQGADETDSGDPRDALLALVGPEGEPDYDSAAYAPLRQAGVSARALGQYDVHLVARRNERAAHPHESLRLYWRYPVWDDDGLPLTWRLAAVDSHHPRSCWDGAAHPLLIYEPLGIIAGHPLVLCGDVLSVWALASLDIPAATFLCGPSAAVPARAVQQVAAARPSSVLVVDNEHPALPRGALAVVRALRTAGVVAGYARLPGSCAPDILGGITMADWLRLGGREGNAAAVRRDLGALFVERRR